MDIEIYDEGGYWGFQAFQDFPDELSKEQHRRLDDAFIQCYMMSDELQGIVSKSEWSEEEAENYIKETIRSIFA